ncbi:hypothetical protein BN946_scf184833.g7 [Trametes cinnabarina]|uniref:ER transporter 6TM N-terminal domain-containing protein n=1 Tax=Pycnoporus cinnabarinus TaxID=5643 RepID=A0A060SNZ3_PYCCI|nr:hypothetical protein BN946_scf184833.g7 [Trametes cinnabarina]
MLPNKSLQTLGNTAFFAFLLSVMVPPNMPVQIFMFIITTIVFGLTLGWALSCAGMAAALAARDQTLLKETLQKTAASAAGLANPDALFQNAIFDGVFLDTRSTVVFGVFLGFGCFFFALIRAYAPKLTIMSVFGTIAMDIFCSFGPLFPFSQYTLLNSLLTSVACYIALALILIIFLFPETLNHSYLASSAELLDKFKGILAMQEEVLNTDPNDVGPGSTLATKANMARIGMLQQLQQLMSQKQFLNLEFSWGRWNGDDVRDMLEPMQILATRLGALNGFAKSMARAHTPASHQDDESASESVSDSGSLATAVDDTLLLRQFRERNDAAEEEFHVRLVDVLPNVREATADLRAAGIGALASLKELVVAVNTNRYKRGTALQDGCLAELDKSLATLRLALDDFKTNRRLIIVQPYQAVLEQADSGTLKKFPLRALYISYVFCANLIVVSNGIITLAQYISETARKHNRARLWAPKGLRAIGKLLRSGRGGGEDAVGEDPQPEQSVESEEKREYKRDPDSRPPQNALQRIANTFHSLYKWSKTPEALFTFRYVMVTIALWIPSVVKSSAHFAYAERSVWALIMAQTTMNIYASDQATFVLVVGYSWIDGNLPGLFQNVGIGWDVAWRRWVLVMIGSAASFILMMLPPKSGRKAVRLRNAAAISGLSYLYSHLTSLWLSAGGPFDRMPEAKDGISSHEGRKWPAELRAKFIALAEQLQDLRVRTMMSKWEGNIRGAWATEDYNKLLDVETDMLANLILLGGALSSLDPDFRKETLPHTHVLNPHFISDVISMFFIISQSLRTGEPLHQAQYKNLADRLHYHGGWAVAGAHAADSKGRKMKLRQSLTSYEYMFYATAVVAVLQMTQALNEARAVVADLCGEVPLVGFERWREAYDREHALA